MILLWSRNLLIRYWIDADVYITSFSSECLGLFHRDSALKLRAVENFSDWLALLLSSFFPLFF